MTLSSNIHVTVHRSSPEAFYVNSFLVHLSEGIVVVDTQFILPEAEKLAQAVHETGKPLLGVLLTHPHPDHVNGTAILRREWPGVPVYATRATAEGIAQLAKPKREQWKPILGDAYPDEIVLPDRIVESGESESIGNLRFHLTDIGPIESINESLIALQEHRILFAGDLFYNQVHPWLVEGRSVHWKKTLEGTYDQLAAYDRIYVGHGEPGDVSSARAQVEYMDFVFNLVRQALATQDPLSSKNAINESVRKQYSNWPLEGLIPMNTDALLHELKS